MSIRNLGLCGLMALGAVVAHQPASASVVLLAGLADDYSLGLPADPAPTPLGSFTTRVPSCAAVGKNFDDTTINRFVCHSFDLSPYAGHIKSAKLEFNAKPGGGQSNNDSVNLYADVSVTSFSLAALSASTWTSPAIGNTHFLIDNVSTLLNLNIVPFLDVLVQDDTTVDYFRLTLEVPEPSSLILAAVALSGLVGSLRRRKITPE